MRSQYFEKIPGHNVDKIDLAAGLKTLKEIGYNDPRTIEVINYNLIRWSKGEEAQATKAAIDKTFYGIDLTSWYRVLASARASAEKE